MAIPLWSVPPRRTNKRPTRGLILPPLRSPSLGYRVNPENRPIYSRGSCDTTFKPKRTTTQPRWTESRPSPAKFHHRAVSERHDLERVVAAFLNTLPNRPQPVLTFHSSSSFWKTVNHQMDPYPTALVRRDLRIHEGVNWRTALSTKSSVRRELRKPNRSSSCCTNVLQPALDIG